MSKNHYGDSYLYEIFIKNAHKCGRNMTNGADQIFMQNLLQYDEGTSKVKGFIESAFNQFLNRDLTNEERNTLNALQNQLKTTFSSSEIMEIVKKGLEVTRRFKDD